VSPTRGDGAKKGEELLADAQRADTNVARMVDGKRDSTTAVKPGTGPGPEAGSETAIVGPAMARCGEGGAIKEMQACGVSIHCRLGYSKRLLHHCVQPVQYSQTLHGTHTVCGAMSCHSQIVLLNRHKICL
jgi:hypothetical protein